MSDKIAVLTFDPPKPTRKELVWAVRRQKEFKKGKKLPPAASKRMHEILGRAYEHRWGAYTTKGPIHQRAAHGIAKYLRSLPPKQRALLGAGLAVIGMGAATLPIQAALIKKVEKETGPPVKHKRVKRIENDKDGKEIVKWVRRFKEDHPKTKEVPVYSTNKIPVSMYVPEMSFKLPEKYLLEEMGIKRPGVYLRENSVPVALHELGHAQSMKAAPAFRIMGIATSALALPLLAYTIMKGKVRGKGPWMYRHAPKLVAGTQVPLLAEEAAASIMAEKEMKKFPKEKKTGKGTLLPAWMTYFTAAATLPTATWVAKRMARI